MNAPTSRLNGLDTLRALAIALVFMNHYMVFVSHEETFGWASRLGGVGVDLFFVLSGYLIANQLFAGIVAGEQVSPIAFYGRRALRTLPAFWVVLAAYFLFPTVMGGRTPPELWRFLTFTQNWQLQPGTAFSHAWSLCVEEQFYLLLPLLLLAGLFIRATRKAGWILLAALLALGVGARICLWLSYGSGDSVLTRAYYPNIYYASLCRFDELLPGVAIAMLRNFHPDVWKRLTRYGNPLLVLGLAAVGLMFFLLYHYFYIDGAGYGFFMTAFGYSLMAMAFAMLVLAALCDSSWLSRLRIPGAHHIALWSYSLYLSHKAIGHIVGTQLQALDTPKWAVLGAVTVCCLLVAAAFFYFVESPFMKMRRRFFPSSFREGMVDEKSKVPA